MNEKEQTTFDKSIQKLEKLYSLFEIGIKPKQNILEKVHEELQQQKGKTKTYKQIIIKQGIDINKIIEETNKILLELGTKIKDIKIFQPNPFWQIIIIYQEEIEHQPKKEEK